MKGKSLPEVSQHFYVCCSFNKSDETTDDGDIEEVLTPSHKPGVLTPSHKPGSVLARLLTGTKDQDIAGKCNKFSASERHLNKTQTKELLQEQENLLRRKSAPIVKIEELENML